MTTKKRIALSKCGLFILSAFWLVVAGLFGTTGFDISAGVPGRTVTLVVAVLNLLALIVLFFQPLVAAVMVAIGLVASIAFLFLHFLTASLGTLVEVSLGLAAFAGLVLFIGSLAQRPVHT